MTATTEADLGAGQKPVLVNAKDRQRCWGGVGAEQECSVFVPHPWRSLKDWSGGGIFLQGENAKNFYIRSRTKANSDLKANSKEVGIWRDYGGD